MFIYKIRLLLKDLKYEKNIFFCTIMIIVIANSCFVGSLNLISYYEKSIENIKNRLGTDIVVVSKEYDSKLKDSLFLGNPSTIKFDSSGLIESLSKQKNINNVSEQLFISSLNSSCCEEQLQFVLFNSKTDKIISSWIDEYKNQFYGRNIIIGSDVNYDIGEKVKFFDVIFCVAGKLSKTGMGYDNCVFLDEKSGESLIKYWGEKNITGKSSLLLIEVKNKKKIDSALNSVNRIIGKKGLVGYKSKELYSDISQNISSITQIVDLFMFMIFIITTIATYSINVMKIQDKKRDIELLNFIGIKNKGIIKIMLSEQLIVSVMGSVMGALLAMSFIVVFKNNLQKILDIKIDIDLDSVMISFMGVMITSIVGIVSIIMSVKLLKKE